MEILYPFSKMGLGNHPRLPRAWQILQSKKDADVRYILDNAPGQALLKPGKRGEANKRITFYAMLTKKLCTTQETA
ncbi:MAG: hypothetical protein JW757_01110 [Anaerolineales bacterium]|nr:hypothetical protein [Anaerolineales bacterium]